MFKPEVQEQKEMTSAAPDKNWGWVSKYVSFVYIFFKMLILYVVLYF